MPAVERIAAKILDGVQYAVSLTAILVAVAAPVSLLIMGDFVFVKYALFFFGFLMVAVGSWKLRPPAKGKRESKLDIDNSYTTNGFGGFIGTLPPAAWYLDDASRLSDGTRILLAGVVCLLCSYLLETVFHVGVPPALR